MALKWLLTQGIDGPESVASGGSRDDNEGRGGDGGERGGGSGEGRGVGEQQRAEEAMAERALEYRKCGRELFTRLLASGMLGWLVCSFRGRGRSFDSFRRRRSLFETASIRLILLRSVGSN